jgi:hypothetical protein
MTSTSTSTSAPSPLAERILTLLQPRDGALAFDDAAVGALIDLVRPHVLAGDASLVDTARTLLQVAHFLDVEKKSAEAANTLLTLVVELAPALRALENEAALAADAAGAGARMRDFHGDARVTKLLDSGARPDGTTRAGPLARFTVAVPPKK